MGEPEILCFFTTLIYFYVLLAYTRQMVFMERVAESIIMSWGIQMVSILENSGRRDTPLQGDVGLIAYLIRPVARHCI